MCGIVGYIGKGMALPVLIEGLKRLEYRGYDSSGVSLLCSDGNLRTLKKAGRLIEVEKRLKEVENCNANIGIAHTRWATHGIPNDINAHPHNDCTGRFSLVHNGIIENYRTIKNFLAGKGHSFASDTDTEVLVHLIEEFYEGDLIMAVRKALKRVQGTFGILVISSEEPDKIIAARMGSPLVIGKSDSQMIIASDTSAIIAHTNQVFYMNDSEIACITKDDISLSTLADNETADATFTEIDLTLDQIEKGGYDHFMLKEIYEQPEALEDTIRGRLDFENGTTRLNGLKDFIQKLSDAERIIITACGTSWHASLIGKYLIENFTDIPVEVDYASEFRYRNPVVNKNTAVIVVSQSGETADTLAALKEAKRKEATVLGICNVVGSSIARETDAGIYTHAGPEIGVASTKAFTSQVMVFVLISLLLGRKKHMKYIDGMKFIQEIRLIPSKVQKILENREHIAKICRKVSGHSNFLYLGRGFNYPVALEGALKLKEISYIHAEGYPAAEMKHGPIALIDENMPALVIALKDSIYDKIVSNIKEIKARKGHVIAIATEGDTEIGEMLEDVIYIPQTLEPLTPLLSVIPLQIISYEIALMRNLDVDKPRNLAKSVTVE